MSNSDNSLTIGVLSEQNSREHRVALDPTATKHLVHAGFTVLVEAGCGSGASFTDENYVAAGATLTTSSQIIATCDVLASLSLPSSDVTDGLTAGRTVIGLLDPLNNLSRVSALAGQGITLVALELLPRTLSRAQSMDALSSQSSAAGYRAAIVAAEKFGRYLPMMITASGTATPAKAIVIGTGVAGLQAIATVKRLGAVVTGYDVRDASRTEVESLGAKFLTSSVAAGAGEGGYARPMTAAEQVVQQKELADALVSFDIIITTAKVPGRTPPLLVSQDTLAALKPGTVCVDLGASDKGGNVFGSSDGESSTTVNGVVVVGAGNLAADLPASSSLMYGRNVAAVLEALAPEGAIAIDPSDEVHSAIVVSHAGDVTSATVRTALNLEPLGSTEPLKAQAN
ncbi:NAD(P)(+) transhydrogenase (Re/Si-specific) subunit alpha [Salinibacterium sp. SWN248]|uniref:NAD(P)(+) transhydrogenase (Re/Si-specific) subunit alpha n=1 Tax=Salinibacterium sp. SWN248 TaxID=2792056 RepID=UPI0018CF1797|nr:NAD(P)(+) transhydrogenase (Re/Si-specific) subunit alpha [Salinibacterium sp. SWN248]MBH0024251.1 NAD(P)(+) transhydrogenase (Re/Si-specific) subunit alpha [Salinibacterium sp. SWN248]